MKIMISSDGPHAHYYIRMGWARVFNAMGHDVGVWDVHEVPAFDAFDEMAVSYTHLTLPTIYSV